MEADVDGAGCGVTAAGAQARMVTPPAIEFRDYSFTYAGSPEAVLEHCDLRVDHGEFVLLSGLSGEGKSTLMSSVNGVIPNYHPGTVSGDVLVDGVSVRGKRIAQIAHMVGSVLQDADDQIVHDKVEDEIAFACECISVDPSRIGGRVEEGCRLMGLDPSWKTASLSGGQKQRLITAATLAMGQRILLLDEPLANLDVSGARMLLSVLRQLADEGYAILLVEHRYDLVMPYVDRVMRIRDRRVSAVRSKEEFISEMDVLLPLCVPAGTSAGTSAGIPARISAETSAGDSAGPDPGRDDDAGLIAIEDAGYRVGGRDILRGVSISVRAGERTVILGQNGCGKTTLLRLVAGLLRLCKGRYTQRLMGERRVGRPEWFRKVAYVCQNPDYQLFMPSVRREVSYGAVSDTACDRAIEEFALGDLLERHPQSLSEGQKRRLGIAAAIALQPAVLLLDEPSVGQDMGGLTAIADAVNELVRTTGAGVVTVTHDRRLVRAVADRIVVMRDGEVVAEGGMETADSFFAGAYDEEA